ncbi:hypothetical protein ACH4S9_32635 [Streptomyces sp. NPDC021225]|uniref:hypothetical protein n=1 Tax=Streptomyces sp. NPDC021225 TaxID=3365121 RepID=UPI00378885AA
MSGRYLDLRLATGDPDGRRSSGRSRFLRVPERYDSDAAAVVVEQTPHVLDRPQYHRAVRHGEARQLARQVGLKGVHVAQVPQPDVDHQIVRAGRDRA